MDRGLQGKVMALFPRAMLAVLVAMAALTLWNQRVVRGRDAPEPASARATVLEYLRALEARDRGGILKLVPAGYQAEAEADERLRQFGGAQAAGASIRLTADITPEVLSADIRTLGPGGKELVWTENLFWREGRWRLVLGGQGDGRPTSDIQRPGP